jgi:hypothetical protein
VRPRILRANAPAQVPLPSSEPAESVAAQAAASVDTVPAKKTLKENVAGLPDSPGDAIIELLAFRGLSARSARDDTHVVNKEGKRASFAIFKSVLRAHEGVLDAIAASSALELYAEAVDDAVENPGKHPTIDLLLRVKKEGLCFVGKIDGDYVALGKSFAVLTRPVVR